MTATENAIKYFANAKSRFKLKGNSDLQNALETIEKKAVTTGLKPDYITTLINVAASGLQVETVNKRLVKALIPATIVPDVAVLKCVSWMCTRKPSINMQCLLVRWILVIYDFIDKMDRIHDLYGIFFHFLHYRSMMPYVCHLLYLLTRKEDIKLFRVRMLIQYQKDLGSQPFLTGLLSIYRHYYPSLVHVVLPRNYKSFFPTYDRKWIGKVRHVREQNGLPAEVNMNWEKALSERLHPSGKSIDLVPSRKRRKIDPIPVIHSLVTKTTYRKDSLEQTLGLARIPFVQVDTLKSILDHIDSIEFPSQIGAVLRSDTLRHLMSYTKDHTAAARFQFWLGETLEEELVHNTSKADYKTRVSSLLTLLKSFSDFLQEGITAVDMILLEYLQKWNGVDFAPLILKLISNCRLYSFNILCTAVLQPLRRIFFSSSVYFKCQVLICLTDLLRNLAANEWPRHQEVDASDTCLSLFCGVDEEVDCTDTLTQYIQFISRMIVAASIKEKHHALFEYCVLDFLDLVSSLHQMYKIPFVVLTESILYERLMISPNPVTVSRVCAIMCRFKVNLISLKRLQRAGEIEIRSSLSTNMVSNCNLLIIDFSNCLWRSKAFMSQNKKSIFNFDPTEEDKSLRGLDLSDSYVFYKHTAFHGDLIGFLKKMEHEANIHLDQDAIKDCKRDFLQYLSVGGLSGISQFVSTFIRSASSVSSMSTTQVLGLSQAANSMAQ